MSAEAVTTTECDTRTDKPAEHSHIVNCPPEWPTTAAWLTEAIAKRLPVTALCGYVWVPGRNPLRFPVCPACVEMANLIVMEEL